jgi:lambda repressor-like predicted transcriptional regulator
MKQNTPNRKEWSPQKIHSQLVLRGLTHLDVATAAGMTRAVISMTIQGDRKGLRARQAIAQALGKPVETIWPDALLPLKERRRRRNAS